MRRSRGEMDNRFGPQARARAKQMVASARECRTRAAQTALARGWFFTPTRPQKRGVTRSRAWPRNAGGAGRRLHDAHPRTRPHNVICRAGRGITAGRDAALRCHLDSTSARPRQLGRLRFFRKTLAQSMRRAASKHRPRSVSVYRRLDGDAAADMADGTRCSTYGHGVGAVTRDERAWLADHRKDWG